MNYQVPMGDFVPSQLIYDSTVRQQLMKSQNDYVKLLDKMKEDKATMKKMLNDSPLLSDYLELLDKMKENEATMKKMLKDFPHLKNLRFNEERRTLIFIH